MARYTELKIDLGQPVDDVTSAPEWKIRAHWDGGCDSTTYRRVGFTWRLACDECGKRL